jgi:hypothetical protein
MGLLDSLFADSGSGGGLLDFLRNNAMNQQFGGGLQSDQAQYGQPPMQAMGQMQPQMPQQALPPMAPPMQAPAPQAGSFADRFNAILPQQASIPPNAQAASSRPRRQADRQQPDGSSDYLKQFSPEVQAAVQNYVDGKSTPTGNPRKGFTQTVKMIAQKVGADTGQQVDDATFAARRQMRNQLSSSAPSSLGGQINIGNTAAGHLADLTQKALELGNYDTGIAPLTALSTTLAASALSRPPRWKP